MFDVTLVPSKDSAEAEWPIEELSSYSSTGYLAGIDKFEELHLDDTKYDNKDACNEIALASTKWTNECQTTITPPRQAHLPDRKEFVPGMNSETTGTMESAEPEWPNEQALHLHSHHRAELNNLEERPDNAQDNIQDCNDKISQTSTWWPARWSITWPYAFDSATPPPSQVYFPNETTHNTTPSNLDRNTSLTGRKANNGFDKTKILLADQLMNRVASMNGSRCRTQATSCKDLTQDRQNLYEEAAEAFIEYAKKLILQSEGPNQRVDDWMVMGFIDEAYTVPENGERKPYLFGEWEYLWAIDRDDIATTKLPIPVKASPRRQSWRENCLWFPEYLIPTLEDWKWWCGEWKKVPGAIWEWKPTEEIWPWQREYWAEAHVLGDKSGVSEDTS